MPEPTHGVVAVGDSLMTGYGLALGGLTAASWASWISWAMPDCLTMHAVNGSTAQQTVRDQLPLLQGRFRLAVCATGANDIEILDEQRFAQALTELCRTLDDHADLTAIATLPLRMRTPRLSWRQAMRRTQEVNHQIRLVADALDIVLIELEPALTGRWSMAPDNQHPTSLGHLEAAHVAAAALDRAGLRFGRHLPDADAILVPANERQLYDVPLRSRIRGRWSSVVNYRADRLAGSSRPAV